MVRARPGKMLMLQRTRSVRERDVLDDNRRRLVDGEGDSICDIGSRHHLFPRPFTRNGVPDICIGRCRIDVQHSHFAGTKLLSDRSRYSFQGKFAAAIYAPIWIRSFRGNRQNIDDTRARRHSRSEMLDQKKGRC